MSTELNKNGPEEENASDLLPFVHQVSTDDLSGPLLPDNKPTLENNEEIDRILAVVIPKAHEVIDGTLGDESPERKRAALINLTALMHAELQKWIKSAAAL